MLANGKNKTGPEGKKRHTCGIIMPDWKWID
jgi:hypothetical protein